MIDLTLSSDEEEETLPPPPGPQPNQDEANDLTQSSDDDEVQERETPLPDTQLQTPQPLQQTDLEVAIPMKCESNHYNLPTPTTTNDSTDEDNAPSLEPSTTSGSGLWDLWTRNFKSTFDALLDLIDNSLDAALPQDQEDSESDTKGRVKIYRDVYKSDTTGLCIRNNSIDEIVPLDQSLGHLFHSEKAHSGSKFIGENGVGLKQAAASLSDLTFVLVKNGSNKELSLGIIARALQSGDGCFLPVFQFNGIDDLEKKMMEQFTKSKYISVARCIAEYGKTNADEGPSLQIGIERLCSHFDQICNKFDDKPYVFEVVLDKIHDRNATEIYGAKDKKATVAKIIETLQHEIPRRYLHIDHESLAFSVGKKELKFRYWQDRLVEFTKIEIPVRSQTPWHKDFGADLPDQYYLRIFLGFDRYRICEPDVEPETGIKISNKMCSLYTYSRPCGRLIKQERDCRNTLRLNNGGTDYCQALTVIIDDVDGHLPVNPTKQDVVFSNQSRGGETHKRNLEEVVRAVVLFYYKHHVKKFGGKKNILTSKISHFFDSELPDEVKCVAKCDLVSFSSLIISSLPSNTHVTLIITCKLQTTYGVFFNQTKTNLIRVDKPEDVEEVVGEDTFFRLLPEEKQLKSPGATAAARKRKAAPEKKAQGNLNSEGRQGTRKKRVKENIQHHLVRSPPRRAKGKAKSYCEDSESDKEEGTSSLDESASPPSKKPSSRKMTSTSSFTSGVQDALENKIDELMNENFSLKAKTERQKKEINELEGQLKEANLQILKLERASKKK